MSVFDYDRVKKMTGGSEKDSGHSAATCPHTHTSTMQMPDGTFLKQCAVCLHQETIASADELKSAIVNQEKQILHEEARVNCNAFIEANPNYHKCPENAELITDWMVGHDMQPTQANFQHAYDTLLVTGKLHTKPSVGPALADLVEMNKQSGPLAVDSKSLWEKQLDELEKEVIAASAASSPNAKALRAEYLAKKASFLKTKINMAEDEKHVFFPEKPWQSSNVIHDKYTGKKVIEVPTGLGKTSIFYGMKFAQNLKAQMPLIASKIMPLPSAAEIVLMNKKETKDDFVPSVAVQDEQKFIQRIGMMSNCNVSIQSKKLGGSMGYASWNTGRQAYRMICDHCKVAQSLDDPKLVEGRQHDNPIIANFCKDHRHLVEAPVSNTAGGRKFRDDAA